MNHYCALQEEFGKTLLLLLVAILELRTSLNISEDILQETHSKVIFQKFL